MQGVTETVSSRMQSASYYRGFLPDLEIYLKTDEKFDVIKLPGQKRLAGPHTETPRGGSAWTPCGEGDHGAMHSPPYHTETQEDFSSRWSLAGQEKQHRQPPLSFISSRGGSAEIIPLVLISSSSLS